MWQFFLIKLCNYKWEADVEIQREIFFFFLIIYISTKESLSLLIFFHGVILFYIYNTQSETKFTRRFAQIYLSPSLYVPEHKELSLFQPKFIKNPVIFCTMHSWLVICWRTLYVVTTEKVKKSFNLSKILTFSSRQQHCNIQEVRSKFPVRLTCCMFQIKWFKKFFLLCLTTRNSYIIPTIFENFSLNATCKIMINDARKYLKLKYTL